MKRILLLLIALVSVASIKAQNCNAVFFTQDGQSFQVVLNGVLQNVDFQTNVKVTDLAFEGNYKVTINFMDKQLPSVTKSIYMMDKSTEYSYEVKMNKKGKYVMRVSNMVPIAEAPKPATTQVVTAYSTTPPPAATPAPAAAPASTTTVTETVTTTTNTDISTTDGTTDNVSMNMNVGGVGMNVNVSVNDNGMSTNTNMNTNATSTSTTTYTETTTVSTSSGYTEGAATTQPVGEATPINNDYTGATGCAYPMSTTEFATAKKSISSKDFSDSKLTIAKQITKSNCLTADQAKQLVELFDFEDTRLEFAKFAYGYTYDLNNFYIVNDAFEFESTIEELNEYIEGVTH